MRKTRSRINASAEEMSMVMIASWAGLFYSHLASFVMCRACQDFYMKINS